MPHATHQSAKQEQLTGHSLSYGVQEIGKAKVFFPLQTDDNLMSNEVLGIACMSFAWLYVDVLSVLTAELVVVQEKEEKQAQLLALQEEVKAETEAVKQLKAGRLQHLSVEAVKATRFRRILHRNEGM